MTFTLRSIISATIVVSGLALAPSAMADEADARTQAVYDDIQKTFGGVPSFVKQLPKAAIPGAWQMTKDMEYSGDTALPAKTKSLIALAVAAQIPCDYCVWSDTNAAKQAGATDEEIAEAVGIAAITRLWSTMFNGLQVDLQQFKKEMGGS